MNDIGNPRDYLANERTHLAWMRTALTVVVLGLAVARFGNDGAASIGSVFAGGILLTAGTGVMIYGSRRYRTTTRELDEGRFDTVRSIDGPIVAAAVLTVSILLTVLILLLVER